MTTRATRIAAFRAGFPIPAAELNAIVDGLYALSGGRTPSPGATPPGSGSDQEEAQTTDDNVDSDDNGPSLTEGQVETWSFATSVTATERLTDADDASTFVDVENLRSITLRKPDGTLVTLIVAEPDVADV